MNERIEERQKKLKEWIIKIGMTNKYFIESYCISIFNNPQEKEIGQYYEKFRKEITRKTTKVEVLEKYFEFLYSLDEFKKVGYVKPLYVEDDSFDDEFNKRMNKISKEITEQLLREELN